MSFDQSYESFKSEEGALPDDCRKERRPWVAPVLTVERVEQTATTFGPAIFVGTVKRLNFMDLRAANR